MDDLYTLNLDAPTVHFTGMAFFSLSLSQHISGITFHTGLYLKKNDFEFVPLSLVAMMAVYIMILDSF